MIIDLTSKAKPCPICGSERIYMFYPKVDVIYSVHIQCADCGLNGFKNFTDQVNIEKVTQRVLDYWNNRVE